MQKVKSNALWRGLSAQQQETLDHRLFDEGLSYVAILPRARAELGFKGQISSLKRYFTRRDKERTLTRYNELRYELLKVQGAPVNEKELRVASMRLLCEFLFQQARLHPDKVKEWGMVANLIVDNDRNELLREVKAEDQRIRREALEFAKTKFQVDTVEQALGALPDLQELAQARRAAVHDAYVENAHLNRARRKMFGVVWEVRPETPEEEAAMLAAKREREAQQNSEQEAEAAGTQEERITVPEPPTPGSAYYQEYLEWKAKREAEEKLQAPNTQAPEKHQTSSLQAAEKPQAAVARKAEQEKSTQEQEAQATEAKHAEQEKRRKYREARARFEEMREDCGWQELSRPPGWMDMDGWKDAPLEWDLEPNDEG